MSCSSNMKCKSGKILFCLQRQIKPHNFLFGHPSWSYWTLKLCPAFNVSEMSVRSRVKRHENFLISFEKIFLSIRRYFKENHSNKCKLLNSFGNCQTPTNPIPMSTLSWFKSSQRWGWFGFYHHHPPHNVTFLNHKNNFHSTWNVES